MRLPNDPLEGRSEEEQREVVAIYLGALADELKRDSRRLDGACKIATKRAKFFPKPADVLERVEETASGALQLEAASAWERALHYATNHWHPDVGVSQRAPILGPVTWHALKAAGGPSQLFNCSREELQWARKHFVDDFVLVHETGKDQDLLGDGEAKRIFAGLVAGPERQLAALPRRDAKPSPTPAAEQADDETPSRSEVRAILDRVTTLENRPKLTEEEWEARKARNKRAVAEWRVARGLPPELTQVELDVAAAIGQGVGISKAVVPKKPIPVQPEVFDLTHLEAAENSVVRA